MVNIRHAKIEDYEDVEKIMRQVQQMHIDWRPDLYKMGRIMFPYEMYLNAVEKHCFIVAEEEKKVVGFLFYEVIHIENDNQVARNVLYVDSMGIEETYRRRGIGHLLFDYVREIKKSGKIDQIELQVNSMNQNARKMYEKYGFREKAVIMELK